MDQDVLAVLEYESIALGVYTLDTLVKESPVRILMVRVIDPGRYLIVFTGSIAVVDAAYKKAVRGTEPAPFLSIFIPQLHGDIIPALNRGGLVLKGKNQQSFEDIKIDSLGILESGSIALGIEAADRAAKYARIRVLQIRIGDEMGGKASVMITGTVGEVEAALDWAGEMLHKKGVLKGKTLIPNPQEEILPHLF